MRANTKAIMLATLACTAAATPVRFASRHWRANTTTLIYPWNATSGGLLSQNGTHESYSSNSFVSSTAASATLTGLGNATTPAYSWALTSSSHSLYTGNATALGSAPTSSSSSGAVYTFLTVLSDDTSQRLTMSDDISTAGDSPFSSSLRQNSVSYTTLTRNPTSTTITTSTKTTTSSEMLTAPSSTLEAFSSKPTPEPNPGLGDTYKLYLGDGSVAQGWPDQSLWVDFDTMWKANRPVIAVSCSGQDSWGNPADPSAKEIDDLWSAIVSISGESGVDARFILAVIMQESKGCVRVPTTNYGFDNPGLMQDFSGEGSCNTGKIVDGVLQPGVVQNPCPASEIEQMVKDGAKGTANDGPGLLQDLKTAGGSDASHNYKAARIYNSGAIHQSKNLDAGIATHCYASDIANRLTGWVNAASKCELDEEGV